MTSSISPSSRSTDQATCRSPWRTTRAARGARSPGTSSASPRSSSGSDWPLRATTGMPPTSPRAASRRLIDSTTLVIGMANRSPPTSEIRQRMTPSVTGRVSVKVVPVPAPVVMSMDPPRSSTAVFTTSSPTPRPDVSVTCEAVENSGVNSTDSSVVPLASESARQQTALDRLGPQRVLVDAGAVVGDLDDDVTAGGARGQPDGRLCLLAGEHPNGSGVSQPWSTALMIRCLSASAMPSSTCLSSSTVVADQLEARRPCRRTARRLSRAGETPRPRGAGAPSPGPSRRRARVRCGPAAPR